MRERISRRRCNDSQSDVFSSSCEKRFPFNFRRISLTSRMSPISLSSSLINRLFRSFGLFFPFSRAIFSALSIMHRATSLDIWSALCRLISRIFLMSSRILERSRLMRSRQAIHLFSLERRPKFGRLIWVSSCDSKVEKITGESI